MLKAEMHTHCWDDPVDFDLKYSAEDLIVEARRKDFDVLSITLHKKFYFPKEYAEAAEKHDVLLIPGVELNVGGADVLAYNITKEEADSINKLEDLEEVRRDDTLIVAPHPYVPLGYAMREKLDEYHDLFDAFEIVHMYPRWFDNWNNKTREASKKYDTPLVGNSDVHYLWQLGKTYTLVDAEKNVESVITAIKEGEVRVVTKHLSTLEIAIFVLTHLYRDAKRAIFSLLGFKK